MKTPRRSVKAGAFGLKASGLNKGRRVRLIENMRVSPQLEICLLNFDGRHFLVAASPNSVVVLDRGESGGSAPSEAEA